MKTKLFVMLLITTAGLLFSCEKSEKSQDETLDVNLIKSPDKFAELMEKRTNESGTFTIEDIKRNADILTISVKGGCKAEDFRVVWDGVILLSYPGQIRLLLNNEATDGCANENKFSISVNLSKILGNRDPKDFVFHVANGSVKQDKSLNPNGTVSTKAN